MPDKPILPKSWEVPTEFRQRLGSSAGRQRMMLHGEHLLLVLHAPPQMDDNHREGRFFWRAANGDWSSSDFGSGPRALTQHLDQYEAALNKLVQEEEKARTADEYLLILERLAPLHRASINLHRVLQEARTALPNASELIDARDQSYEIERTAELLFTSTKNALDVLIARRVEEQSKSSHRMAQASHRLNILVAFFFPMATLTAIFGTNLRHGLEDIAPPLALLALIAVGLLLGAILTVAITRNTNANQPKP